MGIQRLISRVRRVPPHRLDAYAALVVLVETQLEAVLLSSTTDEALAGHGIGLASAVAVALHRRATVVAFLVAQAMFFFAQLAGPIVNDNAFVPLFVVLAVSVSAAAQLHGRLFWLVPAVTAFTGVVGGLLDDFDDTVTGVVMTLVFFTGATALGGRLLDSRLRLQRALREKAERAEAERGERARAAVADERERIAGELHDIIAHALSGMVVQASGARRLVDTRPERAREAFVAVEESGREALGELRRLLGVLRRDDEELALAPAPSLTHVAELARRVTASGLPVRLSVEGEARPLPAGLDVTAYRVVQEALGAALEGSSAGRAEVVVRYRNGNVELEVRDDGPRDDADPRRLVGMRERVALVGGELHVGRPRDGGHALHAWLPVGEGA